MIANKNETSHFELRKKRIDLKTSLPLKMPLCLNIEPTNVCNFKCIQCPQSFDDYKNIPGYPSYMSLDLYKKIINEVKQIGQLKSLKLYNAGEPLLNRDIVQMVRIAKESQVAERIELFTNGALLTEQMSKELIDADLTFLRVSIYSIDEEKNAHITQSKYTPAQIRENVKTFRRLRDESGKKFPHISVKLIDTFSQENEEFIEFYRDIADEIYFEPPVDWNGYENRKLSNKLFEGQEIDKNKIDAEPKNICPISFYSAIIRSNGDVVACCADWNSLTRFGNVKEKSLLQIWYGEELRDFRRIHLENRKKDNESCKNCTFYHIIPDNIDDLSEEQKKKILDYKGEE